MPIDPKAPKGLFENDVIDSYLDKEGEKYSLDDVNYWYSGAAGRGGATASKAVVCKGQNDGSYALPYIGECLYMDVGGWFGSGEKSPENHQRHREFGVVCGNVAALCSFTGKKEQRAALFSKQAHGDALLKSSLFKERIDPFLQYLSRERLQSIVGQWSSKRVDLGDVAILGALEVKDTQLASKKGTRVDDTTLYVFLGDLHLPVMKERDRTYIGGKKDSPHVWRAGRLDLSASFKAEMAIATAGGAVGAAALWRACSRQQLGGWHDDNRRDGVLMSKEEAGEWADYYIGKNGEKGAEISQDSYDDLLELLARVDEWARKNPETKVHVVQTGDLLDFWIGLKLGFGENVTPVNGAAQFVKFWYEETLAAKGSGEVLKWFRWYRRPSKISPRQANPVAPPANLEVTVLYGNHDNYMRLFESPPHPPQFAPDSCVVAEHGHQWDSFNQDEGATDGWALTQAAFVFPKVRDWEDPLAVKLTRAKRGFLAGKNGFLAGDPGSRLNFMARAAEVCKEGGKLIYVMGHTHEPLLKRINLRYQLNSIEVLEGKLRCTTAWANATADAAEQVVKDVEAEPARTEKLAKEYARGKIEDAKRRLTRAKAELEKLAECEFEKYRKEKMGEALRKVKEADGDLVRLGNAPGAEERKKAEKTRLQILEAIRALETLIRTNDLRNEDALQPVDDDIDYVCADVEGDLLALRRRLTAAERELERLDPVSQAYAKESFEEERSDLESKLQERKQSVEKARAGVEELLATAGQRWYAPVSQELVNEASEAAQRLKEARVKLREAG